MRLTPPQEGFPGTISVKFSVDVSGWPKYQMPWKYCRKFQPPDYGARASQTYDRQTTDGRAIAYSEFTFAKTDLLIFSALVSFQGNMYTVFLVFFFRVFYSSFLLVSKRFPCDAFDCVSIFLLLYPLVDAVYCDQHLLQKNCVTSTFQPTCCLSNLAIGGLTSH